MENCMYMYTWSYFEISSCGYPPLPYAYGKYDNSFKKHENQQFDHYKPTASDSFKQMSSDHYSRDNRPSFGNNDFGRYDSKYDQKHFDSYSMGGSGGRGDIFPPSHSSTMNYDDFPDEYSNYRETLQYDSRRTLYVGQLHPIINETQLKDCFMLFGEVVSCKMHKEPQHKSYCFIEFRTKECATAAKIAMNMRKLHDIPIEVNWANTNSTLYNKKKLQKYRKLKKCRCKNGNFKFFSNFIYLKTNSEYSSATFLQK